MCRAQRAVCCAFCPLLWAARADMWAFWAVVSCGARVASDWLDPHDSCKRYFCVFANFFAVGTA
jgi:hypothetical protein